MSLSSISRRAAAYERASARDEFLREYSVPAVQDRADGQLIYLSWRGCDAGRLLRLPNGSYRVVEPQVAQVYASEPQAASVAAGRLGLFDA